MATIYDMVTGKVMHEHQTLNSAEIPESTPAASLRQQTVETGTPVEDMAPVDAYMVMLQELLKKL